MVVLPDKSLPTKCLSVRDLALCEMSHQVFTVSVEAWLENALTDEGVSMPVGRIGRPVRICSIRLFNCERTIESVAGPRSRLGGMCGCARRHSGNRCGNDVRWPWRGRPFGGF